MKNFRFRLQKALDWRRTQFELEEAEYKREIASLNELERARAAMDSDASVVEDRIRAARNLSGEDLIALGGYLLGLSARKQELSLRREEASRRAAARQQSMIAAKRRYRLLEKLKERRLAEWKQGEDRELEELAADSYLAQYCRDRAGRGTTI